MNLPLLAGTLGKTCYGSLQEFYVDMFAKGVAVLPVGTANVWVGDAPPADIVRYPIWARTSAGNPVWPPVWQLFNGNWVAKHPVPASGSELRLWVGSLANLATYDGGDNGAPSAVSGPMWQEYAPLRALMPIGVGSLPSATAIPVTGTGGEENHTLLLTEIPQHQHDMQASGTGGGSNNVVASAGTQLPKTTGVWLTALGGGGKPDGTTAPHNNMPPYYGVYFISRTSRLYYTTPQ